MVPIRQYVTFFTSVVAEITAISRLIRIETDTQMVKKADKLEHNELVLFLVTPSVRDMLADTDNQGDENVCMAYILKKVDPGNMDDADELNTLEETQNAAIALRENISNKRAQCPAPYFTRHIKFNELHPEFNMMGCIGYSWSFYIND
jgi:hypothetical protein